MIVSVVLAVALVMQEGGQIVAVDRHGHLYSPFLRQMMTSHRKASKPATPAPANSDPAPAAPSGD